MRSLAIAWAAALAAWLAAGSSCATDPAASPADQRARAAASRACLDLVALRGFDATGVDTVRHLRDARYEVSLRVVTEDGGKRSQRCLYDDGSGDVWVP